ncbi:MAG: MFS transporter [Hyphomicrobiales bacterium]|nr:MFS transporter [Hyphomicrobiales bacterium]
MQVNTMNLRLALVYMALFAGIGVHLPFFPLWLAAQGLEASDRAIVLAVPMFIRVFLLSFLIDWGLRAGSVARAIIIYALTASVLTAALPFQSSMALLAIFSILSSLAWMPALPLLDALAMGEMRAGRADYGRARLWGSVAFVVLTIAAGAAIEAFQVWVVIPILFAVLVSIAITAAFLPGDAAARPAGDEPRALPTLLERTRTVRPLFLAAALLQASHAVFYVQGSVHWKHLGYSETAIGALWMVAIIAEILMFLWSRRIIARFEAKSLLMMAGAAACLRWSVMAFDPPWPILVPMQILHACSFACTHIATTWLIGRLFTGFLAARAQGLYASLLGAANGVTMLAAGPLYACFGGRAQLAMASIAAIAVVLTLTARADAARDTGSAA